ncbi:MAG: prepilin-type N-terminal cleavage/methylation domain-containing protein [Phycisphaerae bacterium]|nr:prepilin-type N-terminal cleavage/methylation domain-containing protein [Phycisphaerae bacterium]
MRSARRAFTLVEVIVSCAIVAVILLAVQSSIVLLVKTTPDGKTGPSARIAAAKAMDQFADDIRWATTITKDTPNEITLIVPDRNGDGNSETIDYLWNGVAGGPLYRTFNGASISLIGNVQQFALTYDSGTQSVSGGSTTSAETLLASYTGGGLLAPTQNNTVDTNNGVGLLVAPALPSNATQWAVTRVLVYMQAGTASKSDGTIWSACCGLPYTALNAQKNSAQLTSGFSYASFPLSATGFDSHTSVFLQFQGDKGQNAIVQSQSNGLLGTPPTALMYKTTNGGTTWTNQAGQCPLFYLYGTFTTPNANVSQIIAVGVRCTLQAGIDPATQVVSSISFLNKPVLP